MLQEQIEELMQTLPHGVPVNDDTWCKLRSWIINNMSEATRWKDTPLSYEQETDLYRIFGCTNDHYWECVVCDSHREH